VGEAALSFFALRPELGPDATRYRRELFASGQADILRGRKSVKFCVCFKPMVGFW
jgi:hypothetical protein